MAKIAGITPDVASIAQSLRLHHEAGYVPGRVTVTHEHHDHGDSITYTVVLHRHAKEHHDEGHEEEGHGLRCA